jgi:hypothetical protein
MHSEGSRPIVRQCQSLFCLPVARARFSVSKQQEEVARWFSENNRAFHCRQDCLFARLYSPCKPRGSTWMCVLGSPSMRCSHLSFWLCQKQALSQRLSHSLGIFCWSNSHFCGRSEANCETGSWLCSDSAKATREPGVRRQHSHRGTFIADSKLPTCDLVKQVRDAIGGWCNDCCSGRHYEWCWCSCRLGQVVRDDAMRRG